MKKLSKILTCCLLVSMGFNAQAQDWVGCTSSPYSQDYLKTIGEDGVDIRAIDMKIMDNDQVIVLCSYEPSGQDMDMLLVVYDENLNQVKEQHLYGSAQRESPRKLLKNSNGNWVLIGETNSNDLVFIEVNASTWAALPSFSYNAGATERIRNAAALENGGFLLTGNTAPSGTDIDMVLVKIDDNGATIWSQIIGGSKKDANCHAVEDPSTNHICFAGNFGSGSSNDDVVVGELNADGTLCWLRVVRKVGANTQEGGHDVAVYDGKMYVTGISEAYEGLLLIIDLPAVSLIPCQNAPVLDAAIEFDPGTRLSLQNITEQDGRLFLSANKGTGASRNLYMAEISTTGSLIQEWELAESGDDRAGDKCEFILDGDNLYHCGRTTSYSSGRYEGLVMREDLSEDVSCLSTPSITATSKSYQLLTSSSYTQSHCNLATGLCTQLDDQPWTVSHSIPEVVVEEQCNEAKGYDGEGFIKKLPMVSYMPEVPIDVQAIDMVKVSDQEYVMLAEADDLFSNGGLGDFLLMWYDADGNNTHTEQYGSGYEDIPNAIHYFNGNFLVTGSTKMSDPNAPSDPQTPTLPRTDFNLFMVVIENDGALPAPFEILRHGLYDFNYGEDMAQSTVQCVNGDVVISGKTDENGDWDHIHLRLDELCAIVSKTELKHIGDDNQAAAVENPSTGEIWVTGTFENSDPWKTDDNIVLGTLNGAGGLSFFKEYDKSLTSQFPTSNEVGHAITISGNNVLFGGSYSASSSGKDALLGVYNTTTFNTSFFSHGRSSEEEEFLRFENVDGRVLLSGIFENYVSTTSQKDLAIVEVDASGTVSGGRYFGGALDEEPNKGKIVRNTTADEFYFVSTSNSFSSTGLNESSYWRVNSDLAISCHFNCGDPLRQEITDLDPMTQPNPQVANLVYTGQADFGQESVQRMPEVVCIDDNPEATPPIDVTGLANAEGEGLQVYPNPAQDYIIIKLSALSETQSIELINISGQVVMSQRVDQTLKQYTLNTQNIKDGMYLLRCSGLSSQQIVRVQVLH